MRNVYKIGTSTYITNDEEIQEGNYWVYICPINGLDYGDNNNPIVKNNLPPTWFEKLHDKGNYKKIILSDDPKLISEGIQPIDENLLNYLYNNPNYESVDVKEEKKLIWHNTKGEELNVSIKDSYNTVQIQ